MFMSHKGINKYRLFINKKIIIYKYCSLVVTATAAVAVATALLETSSYHTDDDCE